MSGPVLAQTRTGGNIANELNRQELDRVADPAAAPIPVAPQGYAPQGYPWPQVIRRIEATRRRATSRHLYRPSLYSAIPQGYSTLPFHFQGYYATPQGYAAQPYPSDDGVCRFAVPDRPVLR